MRRSRNTASAPASRTRCSASTTGSSAPATICATWSSSARNVRATAPAAGAQGRQPRRSWSRRPSPALLDAACSTIQRSGGEAAQIPGRAARRAGAGRRARLARRTSTPASASSLTRTPPRRHRAPRVRRRPLLKSAEARRLDERAAELQEVYGKPGTLIPRTRRSRSSTARLRAGRGGDGAGPEAGRHPALQGPGRDEPRAAVGNDARSRRRARCSRSRCRMPISPRRYSRP